MSTITRMRRMIGIAVLAGLAAGGSAWAGAVTGVSAVGAGDYHTLLIMANGTVSACGDNDFGQIGDGTSGANRHRLVQTVGLSGVTKIAGGSSHTIALKSDGTVRAWGCNGYGQLGDGTTINRLTSVQVSGLTGVVAVDAGSTHTVALKSNGTVWTWGNNGNGQLGDGTTTTRNTPVQVSGLTGVTAIAAIGARTFALKSDGTVWAWGANFYGDIGDGGGYPGADRLTPVQVVGLTKVIAIAEGVALKNDTTVWTWGGRTLTTPVQVVGLTGATAVAAGGTARYAIKSDGTLWTWGSNQTNATQVSGLTGVTAVAAGGSHTLARKSDTTVWVWGDNQFGQLGDNTTISTNTPKQMQIVGNNPPIAYDFTAFCLPNGSVTSPAAYYDVDADGTWTAKVVSNASHGTVTVTGGINLRYSPAPGFTGMDSFTYRVNDGETNANVATAHVRVCAPGVTAGMLIDIVVNATLYPALSNEVQRLKSDLINEGYTATITPLASGTSAQALWTHLKSVYQAQPLVGTILIGNVARFAPGGIYSDGYYWNMGAFQSAGGQVRARDIWVSRIGISDSTYGTEAELVRRALDANHYYRTGQSRLPHSAYVHQGSDWGGDAAAQLQANVATQIWKNVYVDSCRDSTLNGVEGSDLISELSHGTAKYYYAGMNIDKVHQNLVQSRVMLCLSCTSGKPDGVVNNQLFSRSGGNIFSVGSSTVSYSDYLIFKIPYSAAPHREDFLSMMAAGEKWGTAMLRYFPFEDQDFVTDLANTMIYGDLSMKPLATPANAMPVVASFTKNLSTVAVGQPVTFSVAITDPDGAGAKSPHVPFRHQVEWFMNGFNYGRNAPTYTTDSTRPGWNSVTHTFSAAGTYTIRAEVMDEWRARGWREMTVTVATVATSNNLPPTANAQSVSTAEDTAKAITLTGSDPERSALTYIAAAPAHGTLSGTGASRTYTPAANYNGADNFTFVVSDGALTSTPATVSITVTPVNDAPSCALTAPANGATFTAPAAITLQATAADVDGTIAKVEFFNGAT
ncbi:MAG: tandem-95 repeat protein, partial [Magnetococcus sp. WYHC-3]